MITHWFTEACCAPGAGCYQCAPIACHSQSNWGYCSGEHNACAIENNLNDGPKLAELIEFAQTAVVSSDDMEAARFIRKGYRHVTFNRARHALQITDCKGRIAFHASLGFWQAIAASTALAELEASLGALAGQ